MNKKEKLIELLVDRAKDLGKANDPEKLKAEFESFSEEILENISILDNDDYIREIEAFNA